MTEGQEEELELNWVSRTTNLIKICYFLGMLLKTNYLTSLKLYFLICKMGLIESISQDYTLINITVVSTTEMKHSVSANSYAKITIFAM